MKIGDIEAGVEYAVHDTPNATYRQLPRRVRALEVVTEKEEYWSGSSFHSERKTKNVRRVKVEFLDKPLEAKSSWSRTIASAEEGATKVIEARLVVAPWAQVRDDVKQRLALITEREDMEARYEARVKALGFSNGRRDDFWVNVNQWGGKNHIEVEFHGPAVDRLLELAELGVAYKEERS